MKKRTLYSLLCLAALAFNGCEKTPQEKENLKKWKQTQALLLNTEKKFDATIKPFLSACFYFDTDDNPETAEEMLFLSSSSEQTLLKVFNNAKIGNYRTIEEWERKLCDKTDYRKWISISKQKTKE